MARVRPTTEEDDPETPVEIDPITGEPVNQPGVRVDMDKQKKAARQILIDQVRAQREAMVEEQAYHIEQTKKHHESKAYRERKRSEARANVKVEVPRLNVVVLGAYEVPKMDFIGKADPFVTMEIGKTKRKTTTKMQTLTPRWKESFFFDVPNQTDTMTVQAFDYDMIGDNELIGEIEIPLIVAATSHGRPRVYELQHPDPAVEEKRKSVGKFVLSLMWADEEEEYRMQVIDEIDAIMEHLDTLANARRSFSQMLTARPSFEGLRASFSRSSRASKVGSMGSSDRLDPDDNVKDPKQGKHALQELLGVKKLSTKRPSGDTGPLRGSMRKKSATATSMPTDVQRLTAGATTATGASADAGAEAGTAGAQAGTRPSSDKLLALADKIAAERVAEAKAKRAQREAAKKDPTEDPKYLDPRARREWEKKQKEEQEALAAMQAKEAAKEAARGAKDVLATPSVNDTNKAGAEGAEASGRVAEAVAAGAAAAAAANGERAGADGGNGSGEGGKGWQAARASLGRRQSWADLAASMENDDWKSVEDIAKEAKAQADAEAAAAEAARKSRSSFERRPSLADIADGAAKFRRLSSGAVTGAAAEIAKDGGRASFKEAATKVKRMSRASLSFTAAAAEKLQREIAKVSADVAQEMWKSDAEMLKDS